MSTRSPHADPNLVWINSPRVDSPAMLGAYLSAASADPNWQWTLELREHRHVDFGIPGPQYGPFVIPTPCQSRPCFRCEIMQGGYMFKWIHPLWSSLYQNRRRGIAWTPEETPEDTRRLDDAFVANQRSSQAERRQQMQTFRAAVREAGSLQQHLINMASQSAASPGPQTPNES